MDVVSHVLQRLIRAARRERQVSEFDDAIERNGCDILAR
jgi:hypothetical protein